MQSMESEEAFRMKILEASDNKLRVIDVSRDAEGRHFDDLGGSSEDKDQSSWIANKRKGTFS